MWNTLWGLCHWETHKTQSYKKTTLDDIMEAFLMKSGTFPISEGRNMITSSSWIFSDMNVNCTWSDLWHHRNARSLLSTAPQNMTCHWNWTMDLYLALEILYYATFLLLSVVENKAHFVLECPYITPLEISFHHFLKKLSKWASSLSFNWTIKLALASISWRLLHSITP